MGYQRGYVLIRVIIFLKNMVSNSLGFPVVKNLPANAGDAGEVISIPGSGRSPGKGNGNPLQDSCLENSVDREAWQATVHGPEKSWAWMSTHTTLETGNKGRSNWKFSRGKQKVWWWHSWWTRRKYVEWKQWMGATRKLLKQSCHELLKSCLWKHPTGYQHRLALE